MALQIAESTTSPGFMDLEVGSGYRRGEIDVNHHETGLKRSDRVPVVLIAGYGRSGSTLLDRLLGQVDGFCSVGEMRFLWQWGGVENQLCGCSARFRNCPFWTQVLESAFGSGTKADMAHLARLKERIERKRNLLYLRVPSAAPQSFNDARLEYELALSRIYASILKVSGCHHIIDSSKNPSRGYLLSGMNDIRLDILHLIRDSRAVAYSWQRKKVRPEIHWKKELMPRHGVLHACAEWYGLNLLSEILRPISDSYQRVRYEDLLDNPKKSIMKILGDMGIRNAGLGFLNGDTATLGQDHTVAGNPMRFTTGTISLQLDDEWKHSMDASDKYAVAALTLPLLARYGYFRRG